MQKDNIGITALAGVISALFLWPAGGGAQAAKASYPVMAPLDHYLIADEKAEIALARSSAPASISGAADVMVLRRDGYATAVKGSNGFVCMVERSWAKPTDDAEFWNSKIRAPHCFNPAAARTFLPIFLKKTELVLAGKSKAQILAATTSALDKKELPALAPGAMCYMMAKQQYLSDDDMSWHPHLMFFVSGDAVKSWGANLPGSPVIAGTDPEERVTVFMVLAPTWSDGTPGPSTAH
ncbi:MAG TPA: hypothetical protein VMH81_13235 [Bryobacteraceae bacterium]|nr:hypothetical protein [Bryobacteraceae bacterium]